MEKAALWLSLAALLLCGAVLLLCALDPMGEKSIDPFGQSYRVTELSYCGGMYSFVQIPGNSPLYRISTDGQLLPDVNGGLVPAFEILHMTSAVRSMIRDCKNHQIPGAMLPAAERA